MPALHSLLSFALIMSCMRKHTVYAFRTCSKLDRSPTRRRMGPLLPPGTERTSGERRLHGTDGSRSVVRFLIFRFVPYHRSITSAWCITSSPLILGLELSDDKLAPVLDAVANSEAVAVNQGESDSRMATPTG